MIKPQLKIDSIPILSSVLWCTIFFIFPYYSFGQPNTGHQTNIDILWVGSKFLGVGSPNTMKRVNFSEWDGNASVDIKMDVHANYKIEPTQIWIFIQQHNSSEWLAFGNAWRNDEGFWIVPEVKLGTKQYQGAEFVCRAAVVDKSFQDSLESGDFIEGRGWVQYTKGISNPLKISINKRVIIRTPDKSKPEIFISTISDKAVPGLGPIVAEGTATVGGTLKFGTGPKIENSFIYLLVRPSSSQQWRIYGPASVEEDTWNIQGMPIADPNQLHTANYTLLAIIARQRIPTGRIDDDGWKRHEMAYSREVEVVVEPVSLGFEQPTFPVLIQYVEYIDTSGYLDRLEFDSTSRYEELYSLDRMIGIGGSINRLPESCNIWLFASPIGKNRWESYGKAKIQGYQWSLPISHPLRIKWKSSGFYQFLAIVSKENKNAFGGIHDFSELSDQSYSTSPIIIIEERNPVKFPSENFVFPEISIEKIGEYKAQNAYVNEGLLTNSRISGTVNTEISNLEIYTGIRPNFSNEWLFSAKTKEKEWEIGGLDFGEWRTFIPDSIENLSIVSIATIGRLPVKRLSQEDINKYALATSSTITLQGMSYGSFLPALSQGIGVLRWLGPIIGFLLLLAFILGILWLMRRYLSVVGILFENIAQLLEQVLNEIEYRFSSVKYLKINPKRAFLSILVLCSVIYAILSYFPIYTASLQKVYSLDVTKGNSLASLVIILIALSGIIFHISYDWKNLMSNNREEEARNKEVADDEIVTDNDKVTDSEESADAEKTIKTEEETNAGVVLQTVTWVFMIVVAVFLWVIQGYTYYTYYDVHQQAEPISSWMMGVAAALLGIIEWAGFLYATSLGIDLFAIVFYYIFYAPVYILYWSFTTLANLFK